jgi:hypothetical protein
MSYSRGRRAPPGCSPRNRIEKRDLPETCPRCGEKADWLPMIGPHEPLVGCAFCGIHLYLLSPTEDHGGKG